jgi:hypothetical protein
MLILKNTLKELGHNFNEISAETIEIQRSYYPIRFNTNTGETSYDDMCTSEVNKVKQQYTVNIYKDRALKEGNQIQQTINANGEIEIRIIS